jgi:hypothetical protein
MKPAASLPLELLDVWGLADLRADLSDNQQRACLGLLPALWRWFGPSGGDGYTAGLAQAFSALLRFPVRAALCRVEHNIAPEDATRLGTESARLFTTFVLGGVIREVESSVAFRLGPLKAEDKKRLYSEGWIAMAGDKLEPTALLRQLTAALCPVWVEPVWVIFRPAVAGAWSLGVQGRSELGATTRFPDVNPPLT